MDQKFVVKELEALHKLLVEKEKSFTKLLDKIQKLSQEDLTIFKQQADDLAEIAMFFITRYKKQCAFMDLYIDLMKSSSGMENPEFRDIVEGLTAIFIKLLEENKKIELKLHQ